MACIEHDACRVAVYHAKERFCLTSVGERQSRPPEIFKKDGDIVRYDIGYAIKQLCRRFEHVFVRIVKVACVYLVRVGFGYVPDEVFGLVAERAADTCAYTLCPFFAGVCSAEICSPFFPRGELPSKARFVAFPEGCPMRQIRQMDTDGMSGKVFMIFCRKEYFRTV